MSGRIACIFCGSTTNRSTDEHVLPKHWKATFPPADGMGGRVLSGSGVKEYRLRFDRTPYDAKVPHVCDVCNSGWLREMDTEVKPLIYDLAWGRRRQLDSAEAELLSAWCTKVALVRTYADREAGYAADLTLFGEFMRLRAPSFARSLQVGWCENPTGSLSCNTPLLPAPASANVVTMRIGALFFQVGLSRLSTLEVQRTRQALAASRKHVPLRVMTLIPGQPTSLPAEPITHMEASVCAEPKYLLGEHLFVGSPD